MTISQVITTLPTAPDPSTMTRDQFSTAAAASVLAQKAMVPELNTWTSQVNAIISGTAGDIASGINGATAKTTPVDADLMTLTDSATSFTLKKLTWANLKATLGSTFAALAGSASQAFSASTLSAATTIGVGNATPAASGAGITFPATQSASSDANTLDDYEEGTWTPSPDTGSFSSSNCSYVKIGKQVTLFIDIVVGTGGGTTLNSPIASSVSCANSIYTSGQDFVAGTTLPCLVIGAGGTDMYFRTVGDNVAFSAMTLTAAAVITGAITFTI